MDDRARTALARMVAQEGPAIGEDPRRVEGLLRDMAPTCRAEISVLTACARARVPQVLGQSGGGAPLELRLTRLARELEEDAALAPAAARWGVESWAYALGLPVGVSGHAAPSTSQPSVRTGASDADDVWAPVATPQPVVQRAPQQSVPSHAPIGPGPIGPAPIGPAPIPPGPRVPEQPARSGSASSEWVHASAASVPAQPPPTTAAPAPAPVKKKVRWRRWASGLVALAFVIRGCGALLRMADADAKADAADSTSADSTSAGDDSVAAAPTTAPTTAASPPAAAPVAAAPLVSPGSPGAVAAGGGPREGKWLIKWAQSGVQYTGLLTMTGDDRGEFRVLEGRDSTNVIGIREPVRLVRDDATGATGWVRADTAIVVKGNPPAGFGYSPDQLRYTTGSDGTVQFTQVCDVSNSCMPLLMSFAASKSSK